jgi:hypothetical protein
MLVTPKKTLSLVEAVANGLGVGALTCCLGNAASCGSRADRRL